MAAALPDDAARERLRALVSGYRPLPGIRDEMLDEAGRPRPHWEPVLAALAAAPPGDIDAAFAIADRHQQDSGVYYRVYDHGESKERTWPLSHLPLVVPEEEWKAIGAGLVQRAALLDRVLYDLYGDAGLVRDGALPAAVVAGSPDYLRPVVGVTPRGGRMLQVYAADLGRGPDGRWWVLGDRARPPPAWATRWKTASRSPARCRISMAA